MALDGYNIRRVQQCERPKGVLFMLLLLLTFCLFLVCFYSELTPCTLSPHPCNNNGNCTANEEDESIECQCFEGWQGNNCETGKFDLTTVMPDSFFYLCVINLTSFLVLIIS